MIYDAFGFSSNYPKMWFYLSLRLVYTCLLGLVKSFILFLCSFQGTLRTCLQAPASSQQVPRKDVPRARSHRTQVIG